MLTIDALREMGVQPEEGLNRCLNNEEFYLTLVKTIPAEAGFQKLQEALEGNDLDAAFEAAHALKGVLGNLSLTPIYEPVYEITELLRSRTEMDYTPLMKTILEQRDKLGELCE